MPGPELPSELVNLIISQVDRTALPSTIRVSRTFHQSSSPLLYRAIFIDVSKERFLCHVAEAGQRPFINNCMTPSSVLGMEGAIYMGWYCLWLADAHHQPIYTPLPQRFAHITRLAIHSHALIENECDINPDIYMPSLDTLQIVPYSGPIVMDPPETLDACAPTHPFYIPDVEHLCCPLLRHLRPRRVILGGAETTLTGDGAGLWTDRRPFPPFWVKEIVIFIGCYPVWPGATFLTELPDWVERLTLVFQPFEGSPTWEGAPDQGLGHDPEAAEDPVLVYLYSRLSDICASGAQAVEVVGLEVVDQMGWRGGMTVKEAEECITDGVPLDIAERVVFSTREAWDPREREGGH